MKVKICGITNPEDAFACEESGADALGFVHYPGRARSLALDGIAGICGSVGPMTTRVLVCSPSDTGSALKMADQANVDAIQVYSLDPESLDRVRAGGVKVIRAVSLDRQEASSFSDHADALLFEHSTPGTGASYDYSKVPVECSSRTIIAGGLTVENMGKAMAMKPYALDVSTGVESAMGRKDLGLVREFIRRCRL